MYNVRHTIVNTKWPSFLFHVRLFLAPATVRVAAQEAFVIVNPAPDHSVYRDSIYRREHVSFYEVYCAHFNTPL